MRIKEDYMRNRELKAAYTTNRGYVLGIKSFTNPSDARTLTPFFKKI